MARHSLSEQDLIAGMGREDAARRARTGEVPMFNELPQPVPRGAIFRSHYGCLRDGCGNKIFFNGAVACPKCRPGKAVEELLAGPRRGRRSTK